MSDENVFLNSFASCLARHKKYLLVSVCIFACLGAGKYYNEAVRHKKIIINCSIDSRSIDSNTISMLIQSREILSNVVKDNDLIQYYDTGSDENSLDTAIQDLRSDLIFQNALDVIPGRYEFGVAMHDVKLAKQVLDSVLELTQQKIKSDSKWIRHQKCSYLLVPVRSVHPYFDITVSKMITRLPRIKEILANECGNIENSGLSFIATRDPKFSGKIILVAKGWSECDTESLMKSFIRCINNMTLNEQKNDLSACILCYHAENSASQYSVSLTSYHFLQLLKSNMNLDKDSTSNIRCTVEIENESDFRVDISSGNWVLNSKIADFIKGQIEKLKIPLAEPVYLKSEYDTSSLMNKKLHFDPSSIITVDENSVRPVFSVLDQPHFVKNVGSRWSVVTTVIGFSVLGFMFGLLSAITLESLQMSSVKRQ